MKFLGNRTSLGIALLCTSSAVALSSAAFAQDTSIETVVVTGSRVIADAANSPTPLTIVTTAQLQATSPTSISSALNKLPVFLGSTGNQTSGSAQYNIGAPTLNLRSFGAQRTLVLLDGHRQPSSGTDGTVDIDNLPQMLMQRVDVVTGGASAIYGSDAVTGVVNFVLDKRFTGIKFDINAGISTYSDSGSYNAGIAAGSDIFGGRGHIEGDVRAFHQDGIRAFARPRGAESWLMAGNGTVAQPFYPVPNATWSQLAFGGKISCTGCAANGQQFISNGQLGPFFYGIPTTTGNVNIGGDGVQDTVSSITTSNSDEEAFLRFSYNIDDTTTFSVQGAVTQAYNHGVYIPEYINTGNGTAPNQFFVTNPFLSPAAAAALTPTTGSTFQLFDWMSNNPNRLAITNGLYNTETVTADLAGTMFGKFDWDVFYTYGYNRLKLADPQNISLQKMYAAEDGVPAAGGGVQCYVSTTTYASLYPGCVPLNPFGPTAITDPMFNYLKTNSQYVQSNTLHDVGGSVAGNIFDDWAGPVRAALSAESRWTSLGIISNAQNGPVDCTGLRLCNTNTNIYEQFTIPTLPTVSENVWEFAGEVNVPLLKAVPLVQSLSVDVAGRYTDYSVSGSAETWKVGLDYHVNDEIRFRATNSVDIRAPALYELFQPLNISNSSTPDVHTQSSGNAHAKQSGNPCLVPEVARTYSGGVVLTPEFAPGLTFSIDYYNINMKNAIGSINGASTPIQNICEASGGTSSFCALIERPLPFSNTTSNNFPTTLYTYGLNAAFQRTEGWDIELNYGFQLGDVWADAPGAVSLRMVANYAPVLESVPFPNGPLQLSAVKPVVGSTLVGTSKGHVTSFLAYSLGTWTFNLQDRWISSYPNSYQAGLVFIPSFARVTSQNYQDITIDKKFKIDDQTLDGYFSVQNIGNIQPPVNLANFQTYPGLFEGGVSGSTSQVYDRIGRYFTLGIRASF